MMRILDFLYNINYHLGRNGSLLEKLQIRRCMRVLIRLLANAILPIVLHRSKANLDSSKDSPIVVSLTSFPRRINHVWMVIETMLCQTYKPSSVVLWLSKVQFPKELEDMPTSLLDQTKRGLQIRFVEGDVRSHKKYYYAFHEFEDKYVVTLDDDIFYPTYFLESMMRCKKEHPNDIIASFGSKYTWDSNENKIDYIPGPAPTKVSLKDSLFGTGGGTLFEPTSIIDKMDDLEVIFKMCPTEDDMYINALTKVSGLNVTFHMNGPLLNINIPNNSSLMDVNGSVGDVSSNNTRQVQNIIIHMVERFSKNPFEI